MTLIFKPEYHEYISPDSPEKKWLSVTSLTGFFKQPFDGPAQAAKSSKNKKSKWYGYSEKDILEAWNHESKRATDLGSWYHDQREKDLCEIATIVREEIEIPIIRPIYEDEVKHAPEQVLGSGIYPEHMVYLQSAGICGQSDYVEVINGVVNINDYKTNKEIRTEGYKSWDGRVQKMQYPIQNLDDCHLSHYSIQLSLYMYIILKHNPQLKPGKLTISHITFEEAGRDKFDNPITARNEQGDPIVKDVVTYNLSYLKSEVLSLVSWLKDNRDKIKKK